MDRDLKIRDLFRTNIEEVEAIKRYMKTRGKEIRIRVEGDLYAYETTIFLKGEHYNAVSWAGGDCETTIALKNSDGEYEQDELIENLILELAKEQGKDLEDLEDLDDAERELLCGQVLAKYLDQLY